MFILFAVLAATICAALDVFFVTGREKVSLIIRAYVRDLLVIVPTSLAFQRYVLKYEHFLNSAACKTGDFVKFFLWSLAIGLLVLVVKALVRRVLLVEPSKRPKRPKLAMALRIVAVVLFFLGMAAYTGTVWGKEVFGNVTGDQLLINLTSPTEDTDPAVMMSGYEGPVFQTLLFTALFGVLIFSRFELRYRKKEKTFRIFPELAKRILCIALAAGMLVFGVVYGINEFDLGQLYNAYMLKSKMIDENYAEPREVNLAWPEKPRNLIHIYLESMEYSFTTKDKSGYMDKDLIPNLMQVADEGVVFSDTDLKYGGPQVGTGTQWSIASMVNQLTGLPMKAPGKANTYGSKGQFLPGAYTLGEILEAQGYEQTVMFGASANFGGLRYLFETHGNWKIMDFYYARQNGLIPSDYKVNWGYEDDKLFEFAKDEITRLYNTGKPFNFTMETADTHCPDGYVTPGKEKPFESPYANAVWNSDKDVMAFLEWLKEQPFYENTTVVIIGDHLSMETKFFNFYEFPETYERRQYNVILNPAPGLKTDESVTRNRLWANWDMLPTILASMGVKIEGERLGIGTNLFSGEKTIYEQYGVKKVNKEFEKASPLYTERILNVDNLLDAMRKK